MPASVAGRASRTAATFSSSGMKGETTAPYDTDDAGTPRRLTPSAIPVVVSGYPRPELLASTEWLAENLGRPEVRVVDVRWRPDGSGRAVLGTGHVAGASYLDWRADLVDHEEASGLLLLAGPEQAAAAFSRAGVGDGTTV